MLHVVLELASKYLMLELVPTMKLLDDDVGRIGVKGLIVGNGAFDANNGLATGITTGAVGGGFKGGISEAAI